MKNYACTILSVFAVTVFCFETLAFGLEQSSDWVNPVYKHLVQDKPMPEFDKTLLHRSAITCNSDNEVENVLKENMENRVTSFQFQMDYDFTFSEVKGILNQAFNNITSNDDYLYFNLSQWSNSYSGYNGNVTVNYGFNYLTTKEEEQYTNGKVVEILNAIISDQMTVEQKEKAIHDWIVSKVEYDTSLKEHSAYAALKLGHTVCQGYSLLNFKMLQNVGITSRIISSESMNHAWNMVKVCGNWYHSDLTWDDPVPDVPDRVLYNYYNKSDTEIGTSHYGWDKTSSPEALNEYEEGQCEWGNIDGEDGLTLKDAIIGLQISTAKSPSVSIVLTADVNADNQIGIVEVIYILQQIVTN